MSAPRRRAAPIWQAPTVSGRYPLVAYPRLLTTSGISKPHSQEQTSEITNKITYRMADDFLNGRAQVRRSGATASRMAGSLNSATIPLVSGSPDSHKATWKVCPRRNNDENVRSEDKLSTMILTDDYRPYVVDSMTGSRTG